MSDLYRCLPQVGDLVGFTDEIIDVLREESSGSLFIKYYGQQLKIISITKGFWPAISYTITFHSIPLCKTDVIILEPDGTIAGPSSDRMRKAAVFFSWTGLGQGLEPKNNDGRIECFWCPGTKTDKRGGGMYDICPKCRR